MSIGDYQRERAISKERAQVCEQVMNRAIGLVEGVRKIVALSLELGVDNDKNISRLQEVNMRPTHFPIGESREKWDESELQDMDQKRREFEDDCWNSVYEWCRQISEKSRYVYGS